MGYGGGARASLSLAFHPVFPRERSHFAGYLTLCTTINDNAATLCIGDMSGNWTNDRSHASAQSLAGRKRKVGEEYGSDHVKRLNRRSPSPNHGEDARTFSASRSLRRPSFPSLTRNNTGLVSPSLKHHPRTDECMFTHTRSRPFLSLQLMLRLLGPTRQYPRPSLDKWASTCL